MSGPLEEPPLHDERRFVTLETKIAFQEKTISDLNEVVTEQSRAVDKLTRRITRLEQQLEQLLGQNDAPIEKPPHY